MSDEPDDGARDDLTTPADVLAMPTADRVVVAAGAPVVFVGLAWVLPWLLDVALGLPFFPWQRRLRLADRLTEDVSSWVLSGIALVVGLVVAAVLIHVEPKLTVSDDSLTLAKGDNEQRFDREQVASVHLEGKTLVLQSADGSQLLSQKLSAAPADVRAALDGHGWQVTPWTLPD
jgi:hypothetical protein